MKPKGRSPQKEVDEQKDGSVVVEEVPKTAMRGNPSSEVPEGHVWESFLQIADGPDRSAACVKLNDRSSDRMAPYINKVFNSNLEHDSTERLRRVRGEGRCPGPRVAPPPADEVAPGTPFTTLATYNLHVSRGLRLAKVYFGRHNDCTSVASSTPKVRSLVEILVVFPPKRGSGTAMEWQVWSNHRRGRSEHHLCGLGHHR